MKAAYGGCNQAALRLHLLALLESGKHSDAQVRVAAVAGTTVGGGGADAVAPEGGKAGERKEGPAEQGAVPSSRVVRVHRFILSHRSAFFI